jgi:hypothetical protein
MTGPRLSDEELERLYAEYQASKRAPVDPLKPTRLPTIPRESTISPATRPKSTGLRNDWADAGRAAAQGATFGFADEIEAGVRAPFSDRNYREIRDEIRTTDAQFSDENPLLSAGLNIGGGLISGGAIAKAASAVPKVGRALQAAGMAPKTAATATLPQRIGQASKVGGVYGAVSGAGVADEIEDVPFNSVKGAGIGIGAGALFSGAAEMIRGGRNLIGQIGQGDKPAGPIRSAVQAETPEVAGSRRVLATIGRAGQTLDDVAAKSATADDAAMFGELIDDNQGVRATRIARNVGRSRDAIDESLSQRAAEEPANWYRTVARETGVARPMTPDGFAEEALEAARTTTAPKYDATKTLPIPDGAMATLLDDITQLSDDGLNIWSKARVADKGFPKVPTDQMTVGQLQRLRQVLDAHIKYGESPLNLNSIEHAAQDRLRALRGNVDGVLKQAGGTPFQEADETMAAAFEKGRSFNKGQDASRAGSSEAVDELAREAKDAGAFRTGAASKVLERAAKVPDGTAGQTRNPVAGSLGAPTQRAQTRAAFPDDESFGRAREDAEKIVKRLQTRQRVSGNSTTAANLAEMSDEFMADPSALLQAPLNPVGALKIFGERGARAALQGVNAQQADQMGKILAAGLPGQMSRAEAVAMLQRMEPAIREMLIKQMATRGATGGAASRLLTAPDR